MIEGPQRVEIRLGRLVTLSLVVRAAASPRPAAQACPRAASMAVEPVPVGGGPGARRARSGSPSPARPPRLPAGIRDRRRRRRWPDSTARPARCSSSAPRELGRVPGPSSRPRQALAREAHAVVVDVDWAAAVEAAQQQGEGFGPVRGLRRLGVRVFGAEVAPTTRRLPARARLRTSRASRSGRPPAGRAAISGCAASRPRSCPVAPGALLDRTRRSESLVRALTGLSRGPCRSPASRSTARRHSRSCRRQGQGRDRALGSGRPRARRPRLAPAARDRQLLSLPRNGRPSSASAGPPRRASSPISEARRASAAGRRLPISARNGRRVVPAQAGRERRRRATRAPAPRAALAHEPRRPLVVITAAPERTTAEAQAMGITGLVAAYETIYGGDREPDPQRAARRAPHRRSLIAPGAEFSFNGTTGERTADKGFLEAPVIINGELQTGLGGGVCQVSTTVFNAAYEAGLPITERTNHALYISHYPLGRDATVNYPDLDLKFGNDTGHWLLLRTFVGSSSLTVALYGTPPAPPRRERESPLVVTGGRRVKRVPDPNLYVGQTALEEYGLAVALDERAPPRLHAGREAALRPHLVLVVPPEPRVVRYGTKPAAAAGAPGQTEEEEGTAARRPPPAEPPPRAAGSLGLGLSDRVDQPGRHARRPVAVDASTHAWPSSPSATVSPSRSTAYSKRKRAPRTSLQRACIVSRSSKRAARA